MQSLNGNLKKPQCFKFYLWIKPPYHKIKISGKANPGKIGKQKPSGKLFDVKEFYSRDPNEHQKDKKPDECGKIFPEVEENESPAKIKNKLCTVK